MGPARTKVGVCTIVLLLTSCQVFAMLPKDQKPTKRYTENDTMGYPVFRGESGPDGTPLQYVQGMTKVDDTYVVTARDNLFVMDPGSDPNAAGDINSKQVIHWPSDKADIDLCHNKGKSELQCHNYVKIFEPLTRADHTAIACGTNSFKAQCKYFKKLANDDWEMTPSQTKIGSTACSFDPDVQVACTVADGNLYTGTVTGFNSLDARLTRSPVIVNGSQPGQRDKYLTNDRDQTWLNRPRFIRIVNQPEKMFVFFTEQAVEKNSYQIVSRVAQACKSDEGGPSLLQNQFSTFFKATLNCSLPGRPPFYFNEMSDVTDVVTMTMLDGQSKLRVVFAVMNTPKNSIHGSAVCAFVMEDIESALNGPFMEQQTFMNQQFWGVSPTSPTPHPARCDETMPSSKDEVFIRKHPLMARSVNASDMKSQKVVAGHQAAPVFTWLDDGTFLTTIAADRHPDDATRTTLFTGTVTGSVLRIDGDASSGQYRLVDERKVFNPEKCGDTDRTVRQVRVDRDSGKLLLQFTNCVIVAPLCPLVTKCRKTCLEANDPYCVWRNHSCVSVTTSNLREGAMIAGDEGDCETGVIGVVDTDKPNSNDDRVTLPGDEEALGNDTVLQPPGATAEAARNQTALAVASGPNWVPFAAMGLGVGIFIVLVPICLYFLITTARKRKQQMKPSGKAKPNGKVPNGSVRKNSSRDNRRDSNQSNGRKVRHGSGTSNTRLVSNRGSVHEEGKRKRNITESSNRSEDDPFSGADPAITPGTPGDARSKLLSTSSSHGTRRNPRNSMPSTSSVPETGEEMIAQSPSKRSVDDMAVTFSRSPDREFYDPGGLHLMDSLAEGDSMALPGGKSTRMPPARAMSFSGGGGPKQYNRAYSTDATRATTMGHSRPNMRSIGRQHSLQVMRPGNQPVYVAAQPFHPGMSVVNPPITGPANTWSQQPQPAVVVGPAQNGRYDKRMTHSLDRRQHLKGQTQYQLVPSGEVFNDDGRQMPPKSYANQQQQQQPPSSRKRNVSESAAGSSGAPMHMQMPPFQYQAIQEEQEPLSPGGELLGGGKPRRDNLTLNVNAPFNGNNGGGRENYPGGGFHPSGAPSSAFRPQMFPQAPGLMSPANRQHLRLNIPRSNPGTPQQEALPPFGGEVPYSPSHQSGGNAFFAMPSMSRRPPITQRSLPETGLQRLSRSAGTPEGHSPCKSNPTSPQNGSERELGYPQAERGRHVSGNSIKQLTPSSPVKSFPPSSFAAANGNGNINNNNSNNNSNNSNPNSNNSNPNSNNNTTTPRARHASGPEMARALNGGQGQRNSDPNAKRAAVNGDTLTAPKEFA